MKLAVVVASLDLEKTREYWQTWGVDKETFMTVAVTPRGAPMPQEFVNESCLFLLTEGIVGVVPAFAAGVRAAAELGADIVACLHDDLAIEQKRTALLPWTYEWHSWDEAVRAWFVAKPKCGLVGFGGATSLGDPRIYETPYSPYQLARGGFMSNMKDAEAHGRRELSPRRAVCFDGFSQIGRASLMVKLYNRLETLGVIHHAFDSALGAMAIREGWECWYLPISVHHAGGVTAVGSEAYQEWAKSKVTDGDKGFWEGAHRILYEELRDVLPLRVE